MIRAEWDAMFPRVERERGPGRDHEHDDGGLFERTVAALGA